MKIQKMADLNRRLVVSSIIGLVVIFFIVFSQNLLVSILLALCVAALSCIGVWEYAQLAIAKGVQPAVKLMVIAAGLVVVAFFASLHFVDFPQLPIFVLAVAIVAFFLNRFKDTQDSLVNIAVEFFGISYVAVPLSLMLGVLYPVTHQGMAQEGRWWLLYLITVTKMTDVGAYFIGRLFGKRKLSPMLSPKKTIEGAVAGFICAILTSLLIRSLGQSLSPEQFHLTLFEALWLGALLGIFSQIGDLAESLLKRDAVVKDSNHLPGLGGVLDMVDSLLITTPIVYFFIKLH